MLIYSTPDKRTLESLLLVDLRHESIQEDCTTTFLALPRLLTILGGVWKVLSVNLMSGHFVFSFHCIPQWLFLCISCWWQSSHYCERLRFDRTDCVKAGLKAFSPAKGRANIYVYLCEHYNNKWSLFVNNPTAGVGLQRKRQPFQITPCWKNPPQKTLKETRKETKTYWAHHMSSLFDTLLHWTASVMLQSITFDWQAVG